jgi:hypothetical protein
MLTGSLAGAYYSLPRATLDIDVVLDVDRDQVDDLVQRFTDLGYYVSSTAAREAVRVHGQFNVVDPQSGWKVDLIIRKDRSFSTQEFSRRCPGEVAGVSVSLTTPEDLILAKLEWAKLGDSTLQRRDVAQLVRFRWESLDRDYIDHWVIELGLKDEWDAIVRDVASERESE